MPPALGIEQRAFSFAGKNGELPLVRMEGISHIIIGENSPFFGMKDEPEEAEQAVRQWCKELAVDGLGLMFLEAEPADWTFQMTPLVYVPAGSSSGTVFWENSCASGSAAAGMYLISGQTSAQELNPAPGRGAGETRNPTTEQTPVQTQKAIVRLREPGGLLMVECDFAAGFGNVLLHGRVSRIQ